MPNLVFITGSTGFVGAHLLIHLHQSGRRVRALIRTSSSFEQLRIICNLYNLSFDLLYEAVEWVEGNTLDYVGLCEQLTGVDEVYHCAAFVSFNSKNDKELLQTNIKGTSNMVDAALNCNVKQFCFISSIAALGRSKNNDFIHEETPRKSDGLSSTYSESKFRSELEVWRAISEGLNAVILNPGVVLGPGDPEKGSLLLIKTGRKGMPFYTNATTGYIDVRDICRAAIDLMNKKIFGQRFVLVSDNADNREVFTLIASEFGVRPPRFRAGKTILQLGAFISETYGFLTRTTPQLTRATIKSAQNPQKYSSQKIKDALNFKFIPLKKTIQDTCNFIKENNL
jgi:dihydroflavonol-4-reductase